MCDFGSLFGQGKAQEMQPRATPVASVRDRPETQVKTNDAATLTNGTTGVSVARSKKTARTGVPGLNL